jgi:hypothetical protein
MIKRLCLYYSDTVNKLTCGIWHTPENKFIRCRNRWSIIGQTEWLQTSSSAHAKVLELPLHTGSVLGQPGRIVALIVALLLAVQVSAGILL